MPIARGTAVGRQRSPTSLISCFCRCFCRKGGAGICRSRLLASRSFIIGTMRMAVGVFTQLCPSRLQRLQADKGGSADLKKVLLISNHTTVWLRELVKGSIDNHNHCEGAYETVAHFIAECDRYASLRREICGKAVIIPKWFSIFNRDLVSFLKKSRRFP